MKVSESLRAHMVVNLQRGTESETTLVRIQSGVITVFFSQLLDRWPGVLFTSWGDNTAQDGKII